jgi:hypothetical protein
MGKWVAISRLASPWLTVSKANGEALSNKVGSMETVCIGRQLLANRQKVTFVCWSNAPIERFCGVQHGCAHHHECWAGCATLVG